MPTDSPESIGPRALGDALGDLAGSGPKQVRAGS
jgi:hypothetical protein